MGNLLSIMSVIVVLLISIVLVKYVIPILKKNFTVEEWDELCRLTEAGVKAAEQLYKSGQLLKDKKKDYVFEYLRDHSASMRYDDMDALIESFVYDLNNGILSNKEENKEKEEEI